MSLPRAWSIVLAAVLVAPLGARSQPVPVDTADVMLGVVESLRLKGETEEAERLLELIRRLYPRSEAARSAEIALTDLAATKVERSGRTELIVWSTFYGAALGIVIPAAFGADSPEPYGAGLIVGAPVGYGLSKYYINKYPVTSGQARAMTFGSWWGTFQGLGWQEVLHIGDRTERECVDFGQGTQCFDFRDESEQAPYAAMAIGGLTGMAIGTVVGRTRRITAPTALITNLSAIWGSWFGTVLGVRLDKEETADLGQNDDDALLTSILVAGNVGLVAGAFGGSSLGWSTGDAWTVHLAGIAGVIGGFGIDLLASVDDEDTAFLIPGLTSAAALVTASALVSTSSHPTSTERGPRSSVIDFASGQWSIGIPTPTPTAIPTIRGGKRHLQPAGQVSLLEMRW